jgi:hypothetical protein
MFALSLRIAQPLAREKRDFRRRAPVPTALRSALPALQGHDREVGRPDAAVVKAISRAHDWLGRFERGEVASYHELARAEGFTPGYIRSVMQLAFLAPPLVEAFLDGRLHSGLVTTLDRANPTASAIAGLRPP